jgi:hypothetical protein
MATKTCMSGEFKLEARNKNPNSKLETLNSKQTQMSKTQNSNPQF